MSTHREHPRTAAPTYPDATSVGDHLVIDKVEWVPGADPEPHRAAVGQRRYAESYRYCLRCGVECLRRADFPEACRSEPVVREQGTTGEAAPDAETAGGTRSERERDRERER